MIVTDQLLHLYHLWHAANSWLREHPNDLNAESVRKALLAVQKDLGIGLP